MVTEIIKQEDVRPYFNTLDKWIRDGITKYAVYQLIGKWIYKSKVNSDVNRIRYKNSGLKPINPLKRW